MRWLETWRSSIATGRLIYSEARRNLVIQASGRSRKRQRVGSLGSVLSSRDISFSRRLSSLKGIRNPNSTKSLLFQRSQNVVR